MPITLTATVNGALDANEKLAMIQAIVRVNGASDSGRVNKLPFDTNVTIKDSYQMILKEALDSIHIANLASATDQSASEFARRLLPRLSLASRQRLLLSLLKPPNPNPNSKLPWNEL